MGRDRDHVLTVDAGQQASDRSCPLGSQRRHRRITERDLVKAMAFGAGAGSTIAAHMTPDPVTVAPGDDAATVATRMLDLGVRHLPVTDGARLVGMVSARDLLMAAALAGRPAAGSSSSAGRARPGRVAV